ncbi:MAG: ISKra4 family transposase [Planctomycetaceae bacterium]|nr:ISKra4 family transposase [Planctomycetaceae bacterium]
MNVEIIVRIDGQEVAKLTDEVPTSAALPLEERVEQLKRRVGSVLMEVGCRQLAVQLRRPCCCGRQMENRGKRFVTLTSRSGEFTFERTRYRCRVCRRWLFPADAVVCCGRHRITRLLAQTVCQLATLEHYTRLEQLLADQHGVHLGHDPMMHLVHEVGGVAETRRLVEVEHWQQQPREQRTWPAPEVTPARVYVSCDGIMYCTNETEPDPQHPGQQRLRWKQMRVGCVYWQTPDEQWHKRVIWGQEEDFHSFGAALYRLACRCGYRQAAEQIFAADGGEWCWTIHQNYFGDAHGVLDWYHANEHLWETSRALCADREQAKLWATQAETVLYEQGGTALLQRLLTERKTLRGAKRQAVERLVNYLQPKLDRTDYPTYRRHGWQIGTGMIESTARQLVGLRLKGPGMHWDPAGATAMTALRAQDLNGRWHSFWNTLTLAT